MSLLTTKRPPTLTIVFGRVGLFWSTMMELDVSFKTFRCANSVYQGSRAKADRWNSTGYSGCKARFTARFVNIAASVDVIPNWRIILESEYRTHNHLNCGATHTRVKDIPVDRLNQPDGSSCGVMVIATSYSYIQGHGQFELQQVTK
ncbi:hypothetical protein GN958_ATG01377 [Phytophthora infestans]|uniref:Uncharacterized protein n=1 Tax=Phytophthora infestans TaxID=4787 RepID=A0A8S9V8M6_PHYIN|nr:hypothetical protein GN958_ATG01377 [Phytophthora infestans]